MMAKEKKPVHEKNPIKVLAGQKGGLAKASNFRQGSEATEKSTKRKVATPLPDSSDNADELDDSNPRPSRKKRNMLDTGTGRVASPPPKLNLSNTPSRNEFFPHLVVGNELPLPITIKTHAGQTYRITQPSNHLQEEESFWNMLGELVDEVRSAVGVETFGAVVDCAQGNLHLDLAAHLYPQLLDITGHLRYSKANPSELIVAKKNYRQFLTVIKENATQLLESAKEDLTTRHTPFPISEFSRKLLAIVPRDPAMIPEHKHKTQIEQHEQTLAHAAELIRQELVGVGVVASNYADKARKATITLTSVIVWLQGLMDPENANLTDVASASKVKEEREDTPTTNVDPTTASSSTTVDPTLASSSNADNPTLASSSNADNPIIAGSSTVSNLPRRGILALPEFVVKELFRGHECQCRDCQPRLQQDMYDRARCDLISSQEARISTEEEATIREGLRERLIPEIRQEIRQEIQAKVEEEMRAELWNKALEEESARLAEEMLPTMRKEITDQVTTELTESLRVEVTAQLKAETRRRMEENGVI